MQRHNNLEFAIDGYGNIKSRRKNGKRAKKPHPLADKIVERKEGDVIIKVCPTQGAYGYWPQGTAR